MNDGSSATCAVNFMRNDDEEKKRAADEAKKKTENCEEKTKSFPLETDLRKFITQKYSTSAHDRACKEYRIIEICWSARSKEDEMKLK